MVNQNELKELSDNFFNLWKCEYQKVMEEMCKKYSLSPSTFTIIVFLYNHPQLNTASEICRCSFLKRGIISTIVDDLCSRKLMIQQRDSGDKRLQKIFLTEEGLQIAKESNRQLELILKDSTKDFNEEEWDMIPVILRKMSNNLKLRSEK